MEYPAGFPNQSRAAVESEEVRAGLDLDAARQRIPWSRYGPSEGLEAEVRKYVMRIYVVFVREACKAGCLLGVDLIRSQAREFLRVLTSNAWLEKGFDTGGTVYPGQIRRLQEMTLHGSVSPEVMSKLEKSTQWRECEEAMLAVAEAQALAGKGPSMDDYVGRGTLSAPAQRPRGRPLIISLDRKRQALDAKQRRENTNRDAAKILYGTEHPTLNQVKNVPAILNHYRKSLKDKKS